MLTQNKEYQKYLPHTYGIVITFITVRPEHRLLYEFDFLDELGSLLYTYTTSYHSYLELAKEIIHIKKQCKNNLVILQFREDSRYKEDFEAIDEMLQESYEEGFENGFSEDMSWVIFAIEKLIEEGKINDKLVLKKLRKKIGDSTWEEKENWFENGHQTILDDILTEEEYLKKLKEKKRKKQDKDQQGENNEKI